MKANEIAVPGFYWYCPDDQLGAVVVEVCACDDGSPLRVTVPDSPLPRWLSELDGEFRGPVPAETARE
jgi:hypothetical protein